MKERKKSYAGGHKNSGLIESEWEKQVRVLGSHKKTHDLKNQWRKSMTEWSKFQIHKTWAAEKKDGINVRMWRKHKKIETGMVTGREEGGDVLHTGLERDMLALWGKGENWQQSCCKQLSLCALKD